MSKKNNELTFYKEAATRLKSLWSNVDSGTDDRPKIDSRIVKLMRCDVVAIRYALPTQLLGKLVNPALDAMCLQKGKNEEPGKWDPRSFAQKTIVPWVNDNQNILGTSGDPYVSKPLRRPYIEEDMGNVRDPELWNILHSLLKEAQSDNKGIVAQRMFCQVLFVCHDLLAEYNFEYLVPKRVDSKTVVNLIDDFLRESSGGARGLAVASALFKTLQCKFAIYSEVRRGLINASDRSTGLVGDIECVGHEGEVVLGVEVKERDLSLADIQSAALKARQVCLNDLLLNAPGIVEDDRENINEHERKTWASGTHVYRLSIIELFSGLAPIIGGDGMIQYLQLVGQELDDFATHPRDRRRWKELLEGI